MKLYAIHAPRAAEAFAGPEGARATRTGFSLAALVFGPLWLLVRGLWLALTGYAVLAALVVLALHEGWLRLGAALLLFALAHLYLAVEGRALRLRARWRAGRPLVDVVHAHSALEAEKIYLDRALGTNAPPPSTPAPRAQPPGGGDVIGLFPEPGR